MTDSITMVKHLVRTWLLSEGFVDEIGRVNARLEGIVVPAPAVVYPHELAVPPARFPSAELLGLNSTPVGDSSVQQYRHAIDVLWTVAGDQEDTIVTIVEGLIYATRQLTFRQTLPLPDGTSAPMIPGVENYGPLMSRMRNQTQPLVKAATIRLLVPTFGGRES